MTVKELSGLGVWQKRDGKIKEINAPYMNKDFFTYFLPFKCLKRGYIDYHTLLLLKVTDHDRQQGR